MINWSLINRIRRFLRIGICKTLYINFTKLPFSQAIKLPILVTRNTYFYDLSGKIIIDANVKPFMIRIGYLGEDTSTWKDGRTLLKIKGTLIFKGNSNYGNGVTFKIEPTATVVIGDNVLINYNTKIISYEKIEIGNNCRFAWEIQIMDTSLHYIKEIETGKIYPRNAPIRLGNNNWIGNRANIMKGTITPDYCIIAGGSLCNKEYDVPNYSLIAGIPAKLKKTGIYRVLDVEEAEIDNNLYKK